MLRSACYEPPGYSYTGESFPKHHMQGKVGLFMTTFSRRALYCMPIGEKVAGQEKVSHKEDLERIHSVKLDC